MVLKSLFLSNNILLNTVIQLQVTILNTNNLQLYGIKYSYQVQIIFKQIYLTHSWDPLTMGQREFGSNGNKDVLHTPLSSRTGTSTSDAVYCHIQNTNLFIFFLILFIGRDILLLCRGCSWHISGPADRAV